MTTYTKLAIKKLALSVNLGWRTQERKDEQNVFLECDIYFATPPKGCETDHLDDSVCYAKMIDAVRAHITDKHYRLIERLACDIHAVGKAFLSPQDKLLIRIIKYPKIGGLTDGVAFEFGDQ